MKAITLWQPWAHLMAIGAKRIETRPMRTHIRGWVLIHAAKKVSRAQKALMEAWSEDERKGFATGAVVCAVRLVDCVRPDKVVVESTFDSGQSQLESVATERAMDDEDGVFEDDLDIEIVLTISAHEAQYGNYEPGRFAWITDMVVRLETPVVWRGSQGWFEVDDSVLPADLPDM